MGIVDLNNSELLEHAAVKVNLLVLERLKNDVADVAGEQVADLLELLKFATKLVNFVGHSSSVRARLEHRSDGSFSSTHILHVLVSARLFRNDGTEH